MGQGRDWRAWLAEMGVNDRAIAHFHLTPAANGRGIDVPCALGEQVIHRLRLFEPTANGLKEIAPSKTEFPEQPVVYDPVAGAVAAAVKAADGVLILNEGPKACWCWAAAGYTNVTATFGSNMPDALARWLVEWDVRTLIQVVDLDEAGMRAAWTVRQMLRQANSPTRHVALRLPGEVVKSHGVDFADIWKYCDFDPAAVDEMVNPAEISVWLEHELAHFAPPPPKEQAPRSPAATTGEGESWFRDYVADLKQQLEGQKSKREGNITRFQCVNPAHPDEHPSARVSYSKDADLGIYICNCDADINWMKVGQWLGSPWEQFLERKQEDSRRERMQRATQPVRADQVLAPPATPPAAAVAEPAAALSTLPYYDPDLFDYGVKPDDVPIEKILFNDQDAARLYRERLLGIYILPSAPVIFPFKTFHPLGGVFKVASRGDIYGWLGLSGYGKTAWIDSMNDVYRQVGLNVLKWSPEVPWWKDADRLSQRWGGATVTDSLLSDLDHYERRHESEVRFGVELAGEVVERSIGLVEMSAKWPGRLFVLDQFGMNSMYMLAAMQRAVQFARERMNIQIDVIEIDYMQLATIPTWLFGKFTLEDVTTRFKALCGAVGTIGHITSQVRKEDTRAAIGGDMLMQDAGMFLRDFQFKGFTSITPHFLDDNAQHVGNTGIFNVTKNSEGRRQKVSLVADWPRVRFLDRLSPVLLDERGGGRGRKTAAYAPIPEGNADDEG